MPRRSLFPMLLCAALLVPAGTAAAKSKFVTVTFSGSGATEKTTVNMSMNAAPNCTITADGAIDVTAFAWAAKFNRVPIPRKGQVTFKTARAKLTGTNAFKINTQLTPGCNEPSPPPVDCVKDLATETVRATLTLRRKGSKIVATADLFPDRRAPRPEQPSSNDCAERVMRDPAYMARMNIPASGRTFKKSFDQTINASLPAQSRGHYEADESDIPGFDGTYKLVSDVSFTAALSARYLRR